LRNGPRYERDGIFVAIARKTPKIWTVLAFHALSDAAMNARFFLNYAKLPTTVGFILGLAACGVSTKELLDGEFLTKGQNSIDLLSPKDGASVDASPVFSWSVKPGISLYQIELSTVENFATLALSREVTGGSYKLAAADMAPNQLLKSVRYFWRVSAAKVGTSLRSGTASIQVLVNDIIYVDANSQANLQTGNLSAPLKTIQGAIEYVDSLRNGDATLSRRIFVAQGTYNENITLKPGISLYGGYSSGNEFATRNTAVHVTTIQAPTMIAVQALSNITAAYTASTIIDGFRIVGGSITGVVNAAIYLSSSNPTISNNNIIGGTAGTPYGIRSDSSSPTITLNTISGGSTPTLSATAYGIHCIAGSPRITNNTITGGAAFNVNGISSASGATATIIGNTIRGGVGNSNSYAINNNSAAPAEITGNFIHGGSATSSYGIYNQLSSPPITNNIIFGGSGDNAYGVFNGTSAPTMTNNLIVASGWDTSYGVNISISSSTSRITNNIFVTGGQYRTHFRESDPAPDPRSFENNVFWDSWAGANGTLYLNEGSLPLNSIATIEALTDFNGGADKGRGNILLTAGTAGNPFVNFPTFFDATSSTNVGSGTILRIEDGRCALAPLYVAGEYIEWNGDGIARQIVSCNGGASPDELTITPPLTDTSANAGRVEIRYWGTKSQGGSQYALDFQLQQNSLPLQTYNNLRYGGKNTATNNCGAPSGGPGVGVGGESCNAVTTDRAGITRTTANAGLANNNTVPNATGGATAAVPGGFSIGPHERD